MLNSKPWTNQLKKHRQLIISIDKKICIFLSGFTVHRFLIKKMNFLVRYPKMKIFMHQELQWQLKF